MKQKGRPALVEIEWKDACLRMVNTPLSKVKDEAQFSLRHTAGYLVYQDEEKTVLAITYDKAESEGEEDAADDLYTIPTGWVVSVRPIRRAGKPKSPKKAKARKP